MEAITGVTTFGVGTINIYAPDKLFGISLVSYNVTYLFPIYKTYEPIAYL